MAIFEIPVVPNRPFFTLKTQLDGAEYLLTLKWNQRFEFWAMSIDRSGVNLAHGVVLRVGRSLLRQYVDRQLPPGDIFCQSTVSNDDSDPTIDDLGDRVKLYYSDTNQRRLSL